MMDSNFQTHDVQNQSPVYGGHNAFLSDPLLRLIAGSLNKPVQENLAAHGKWAGSPDTIALAVMANQNGPVLKTHDQKGNRLDQVEFHPAYHAFMRKSVSQGLHASIWSDSEAERGQRNLARAVKFFLTSTVECGHQCPITMTNASVAALLQSPDILKEWLPRIRSPQYDPSHKPPVQKKGLTIGMGLTEKQGGSDVRAGTTRATASGDGVWHITGHKWFFSAPMCDAFLVTAQTDQGLSCFLMPRILPDGTLNKARLQRLKNKLGNKSNASSEVEFTGALANLVGEPGKGIKTILEMITLTRLDCILQSAGIMRASVAEAVHHARHRKAFGKELIQQPLMARVLADLSLEVAAATALSHRLALSFDLASGDEENAAYARLMTPVIKYWVCKIAPGVVNESMECLGGNGYVEEGNLARHHREAPLNAIWEGSGNIMCLDVMRVISQDSRMLQLVLGTLERDLGGPGAAKTVDVIRSAAGMAQADPGSARILTEQLALTAAAAELRRLHQGQVADAFVETRLGGLWRNTYGMIDNRHNANSIIEQLYIPA